jgi:ElaB/YqjD/DUF883 family membrane-anchored ribosome-binding protein
MARNRSGDFASLRAELERLTDLVERYRNDKDETVASDLIDRAQAFINRASDVTGRAAEYSFDRVSSAGRDVAQAAADTTSEALEEFETTVSRHPVTTILAATGVGLLLGMLLRRD